MKAHPSRRLVVGALAGAPLSANLVTSARAQEIDRLEVGRPLERFDLLKPGARTWLRSREKDGVHVATDIWRRETRFEDVDGVRRLRIVQRWDGTGATPSLVERDSIFEMQTFRPLTHLRITTTGAGVRTVEGFRFAPDAITGLADLADNRRAGFSVASSEPMYNFETDMEMLQTLPWAAGHAVSIPFYHPGGGAPARYVWRAASDEIVVGPDSAGIPCWIVETDYNAAGAPPARFWLAKSTQQLLRMEHRAPDGVLHRKTLLY